LPLFATKKQSQFKAKTKPILSAGGGFHLEAKINANCLSQRDYEQKMVFFRQKNKANSKPISTMPKNEYNLCIKKTYENISLLEAKKTKPKQSQFKEYQTKTFGCRRPK